MIKFTISLLLLSSLALVPLPSTEAALNEPQNREVLLLPRLEVYESFSLGYRNALAELLWFKINNYFGKHFQGSKNYPWLNHMCQLILKLDSNPTHTFEFCASMLAYEAKDTAAAIAILDEAVKAHPKVWKFWFLRGFFYSYLLKDKEKAAEDYKVVGTLEGVPDGILRVTIERTARTILELISNLEAIYSSTQNTKVREVLLEKIRRARLTRDLEFLEEAQKKHVEKLGKGAVSLEELLSAGLIPKIPLDPWGGKYFINPNSGEFKSSSSKKPLRFDEF